MKYRITLMNTPDFWTLFKDYLPILTGLITLTSAGVFGYLLQDISKSKENTAAKTLKSTLEIYSDLKAHKLITAKDEREFTDLIYDLKQKTLTEGKQIAARRKEFFGSEAVRKFSGALGLSLILIIVELFLYATFIYTLTEQRIDAYILFGLGVIALLIYLYKAK